MVWHPQFAPSLCLPRTLSSCDANRPQQEPQVLSATERGRPSLQCAAISPPAKQGQQHTRPQPGGLPGSQGANCLLWHASLFPPFFKCMPKITLSPSEYYFLIFYWRSFGFWHYQNNKTTYFHHYGVFFILFGVFFFFYEEIFYPCDRKIWTKKESHWPRDHLSIPTLLLPCQPSKIPQSTTSSWLFSEKLQQSYKNNGEVCFTQRVNVLQLPM